MAPRSFSQSGNKDYSSSPKHVGRKNVEALNPSKFKDSREHGTGTKGDLTKNKSLSSSPRFPPHLNGSGVHTPHPSRSQDIKSMKINFGNDGHHRNEDSPRPRQYPSSHMSNPDASLATYSNHIHHQKGKKRKRFTRDGEEDEGEDARDRGCFKQRKENKARKHGHHEDDEPSTHESNKTLKTDASHRIFSHTSSSSHHKGKKMDAKKNKVEARDSDRISLKRKEERDTKDRQEEKAAAVRSSSSSPCSDSSTGKDDGGHKQNRKKHFQKPRGDPLSVMNSSSSSSFSTSPLRSPSVSSPSGKGSLSSSSHPSQKSPFYRAPKTEEDRMEERKRSVFVTQLPVDAETEEIQRLFSRFGDIATIKVVGGGGGGEQGQGPSSSSLAGRSQRRSAFVIFKEEGSASRALVAAGRHEDDVEGSVRKKQPLKKNVSLKNEGVKNLSHGGTGLSVFAAQALGVDPSPQEENEDDEDEEDQEKFSPGWQRSDLQLRGQPLIVREVLAREEAQELAKKAAGIMKKDRSTRRNLHLAYEGMMSPHSEAFTLLPPPEQRRRLQAWREKKEKLKNPNYSVNATRLSVRNLPTAVVANDLRQKMSHFLLRSEAFAELQNRRLTSERKRNGSLTPDSQTVPPKTFHDLPSKRQRRLAEQAILKVRIVRDKERLAASTLDQSQAGPKRSLGFAFVDCADEEIAKLLLVFLGGCSSTDFLPQHLFKTGDEEATESQQTSGENRDKSSREERAPRKKEKPSMQTPAWRKLMVEYAVEDARKVKIKVCQVKGRELGFFLWKRVSYIGVERNPFDYFPRGVLSLKRINSCCMSPLSQEERRRAYVQMLEAHRQQVAKEEGIEEGRRQRERRRQKRLEALGLSGQQDGGSITEGESQEKPNMASSGGLSSHEGKHHKEMRSGRGSEVAAVASRKDKKKAERKKGRHQDADDEEGDDQEVLVFDEAGEEKGSDGRKQFSKKAMSGSFGSRRERKQRRSEEDKGDLEEEGLRKRVRSLLAGQA
ncbi:rna recognition motif-containing protein [Cystoisospora suis]|uniref:Rna recognition motif-containing protein n=1 Tax=Cystoisospora suis TaxID=483139 RepID=A0A2C6KTV5_9APIC|nr:rna recognition motif-containing protein [Cystoisospora suis]